VICMLRPDKRAASWQFIEQVRQKLGDYYTEIALDPLSNENSRELLGNLLHIEDLPDSVRTLILEKAEGNPFFVEEVIRSLIDSKHIVREGEHWRATHDITNAAIPDTLAGVLGARIDRLPADTKRVTQAASVVGRIFAYQVLKRMCEAAPISERIEQLDPHLKVLSYEELVRERNGNPELEYIFKHALTQEAAYNSLLLKRRKEFHRRTADALAQLYPERLDELAPTLALHCWQGEEWTQAADYSIRAGAGAAKVYSMRAAIDHYRRAIEALEKAPDAPPEQLYNALIGWVQAAFKFKAYEDILVQGERAVTIARSLGDKRRLAEALYWNASTHIARGRPTRGLPILIEGFALAEELGDERLSILPSFAQAFMQMDTDPRAAIAKFDHSIELAHEYKDRDTEAVALAIKAMVAARLGDFTQSQQAVGTAYQLVDGLNSPMVEADVDLFTAWSYLEMGDADRGLERGQAAIQKATTTDKIECLCSGYACVGFGHLQQSNLLDASKAFEEAIHRAAISGAEQTGDLARTGLAMADFLGGQSEAVKDMENTLENAMARDDPYTTAFLSQSLGDSYMQLGELARADRYLHAALNYYRTNDMRPYLVRTLQSLASLYDREGRGTDASLARTQVDDLAKELQLHINPATLTRPGV
jgi:tetratricopeptide (TPR) repeat protein